MKTLPCSSSLVTAIRPPWASMVVSVSIPGHEIEHPMAIVILGGLLTSTLLNLLVLPSLYLAFGKSGKERAALESLEATTARA